ncbi:Uncharacterised protein [Zhongshania aliphaticivorans]|nr:Uncharacterised protein [Zhongshania aliphaticivorans]
MMIDVLISLANGLFAWTIMAVLLSWILAGAYPFLVYSSSKAKTNHAALFTFIYGLIAPASATISLVILSLPALAFPLIADHCHDVICEPHVLYMHTNTVEGVVTIAATITFVTGIFILMAAQLFRGRRQLLALSQLSVTSSTSYRIVDSKEHLAWCAGLLRPIVYLSQGLLNDLSAQQVRMILLHELSHAIRRDNLRKWLIHWATVVWPKHRKDMIRRRLSSLHERICDLTAAKAVGDSAELSNIVESLEQYQSVKNGNAIHRNEFQLRVNTLDYEYSAISNSSDCFRVGGFVAALWFVLTIAAIHFGHPFLEWLSR